MAKITVVNRCPTIEAIYAAREARQGDNRRTHLGASVLGGPCERAIWYSWRWATDVRHAGRLLRLFETGQLAEERFVADLRAAGVTIYEIDEATGDQFRVSAVDGHLGGSLDGIGIGFHAAPKKWHVVEMKTHSEKSYKELVAKGVAVAKPQHVAQLTVYMGLTGLDRAFYLAVNKNTDELHSERVHFDPALFEQLMAKAERIIRSNNPPPRLSDDPTFWICRFCDHADLCRGNAAAVRHCRTCLSVTPTVDAMWLCERHGNTLEPKEQKAGCDKHLYVPALVPGEQIDATEDTVLYRMPDGSEWVDDGP